jgi:hypothetical protein
VLVIHIPFVLRYTTIRYSIVAPRPCLMSLAVSGCSCAMPASACACASMDRFVLLGLFLQVYVSSVTVEMNHVHKRMIMPTYANTRGRPTRPVMCNGMIITIDHFITMTPLDHRTTGRSHPPTRTQYRISISATPTDCTWDLPPPLLHNADAGSLQACSNDHKSRKNLRCKTKW